MSLPLNGVPFSGNQARPFIRAPFQPIQPQLLMPQYQVPPNPSSQPLVPVQMHNGPLLHTPSSSTSSRLVRPMPLFVPPQSTQASRQQPALGPIPQTSYAPAVRPTMPPNPQVPRQQATAVQNPVVQNPVNAQRAVAGPSGSRVLGRPSENPEVKKAARLHADRLFCSWKQNIESTMSALENTVAAELLNINDRHTVSLHNLKSKCNSLQRELHASNTVQQRLFDDAMAWKNKWAESEQRCAYYKHSLDQFQTFSKWLLGQNARILSDYNSLKDSMLGTKGYDGCSAQSHQVPGFATQPGTTICSSQPSECQSSKGKDVQDMPESQDGVDANNDAECSPHGGIKVEQGLFTLFSSPSDAVQLVSKDLASAFQLGSSASQPRNSDVEIAFKQELDIIANLTQADDDPKECMNEDNPVDEGCAQPHTESNQQRIQSTEPVVQDDDRPFEATTSTISETITQNTTDTNSGQGLSHIPSPNGSYMYELAPGEPQLKRRRTEETVEATTTIVPPAPSVQTQPSNDVDMTVPCVQVEDVPPQSARDENSASIIEGHNEVEVNGHGPHVEHQPASLQSPEVKKSLGILHIQLLYHQTNSGYACRVCLRRADLENSNWKHIQRFPPDAPLDELTKHIKETHPEAYKRILRTPHHKLIEFRTKLVACK